MKAWGMTKRWCNRCKGISALHTGMPRAMSKQGHSGRLVTQNINKMKASEIGKIFCDRLNIHTSCSSAEHLSIATDFTTYAVFLLMSFLILE